MTLLGVASSYSKHVRDGETLLAPIYIHFRELKSGRLFFAMRNTIGSGPFRAVYDLKACADDKTMELDGQPIKAVHKRWYKMGMKCGTCAWTPERHRYYNGKKAARHVSISLYDDQRDKVIECIARDTAWLTSHQLMDYSLLVAVKDASATGGFATGGSGPSTLGQRFLVKSDDGLDVNALHVAIIDYLQRWTNGKRVARCIKLLEFDKATVPPDIYGARFLKDFSARMAVVSKPTEACDTLAALPAAVAPPLGDVEDEGQPEDRINSRMTEDRVASRQNMEDPQDPQDPEPVRLGKTRL
jgi:hypothetical protein